VLGCVDRFGLFGLLGGDVWLLGIWVGFWGCVGGSVCLAGSSGTVFVLSCWVRLSGCEDAVLLDCWPSRC
jgi:hypothetical protein